MALFRLFIFFYALISQISFAQPSFKKESDEWILTRQSSSRHWIKILAGIVELELINTFGPQEKYALERSKSRIKNTLPKEILALQRNHPYQAFDLKDPEMGQSWGLVNTGQSIQAVGPGLAGVDVGAVKTWEFETGSKKEIVAVLDTGIDLKHEDLKNNLWINKLEMLINSLDDDHNGYINDLNGWNFVDENNNIQDDNNHGSAVVGVIAADSKNGKGSRGLIENGSLMIVKILDRNGTGTTERAVRGIQYAVKNGASVINASWGGTLFDQVLFDTIRWANDQGVLVICAAGNEAKDNDSDESPSYPASFQLPNIVSVAAHDSKGNLAPFSSYGKQTVHLSAPGVGIFSSVQGGYQLMNGTSFAAPFVSAVSALLKSQVPTLNPSELRSRVINTVIPMHYYLKEKLNSGGRLHSYNALKNIISPKVQSPTQWKRILKNLDTAHPYHNDTKQVFEISQPGASHVRVHFANFDLEKQYDYVSLKDKEGLVAMTYSGKQDSFWSADVLGDTLKIEFISDFSNPQWGFAIDAFEFSP